MRCATGIILAGEIWKHSPVRVMRMVLAFLDGYRAGVVAMTRRAGRKGPTRRDPAAVLAMKADRKGPISGLIARSVARTQGDLLDRLTRARPGGGLTLKRSGRFFEVDAGIARAVARAVGEYATARGEAGGFEVVDVARRVAGIGSLGVRRYAALVAGDGSPGGHRLFDIKEAAPPSIREFAAAEGLLDGDSTTQARRIVDAQRLIQERPSTGLDVLGVAGVGCRIRELVPEESRARLDRFHRDTSKLRRGLDHAGWIRRARPHPRRRRRRGPGRGAGRLGLRHGARCRTRLGRPVPTGTTATTRHSGGPSSTSRRPAEAGPRPVPPRPVRTRPVPPYPLHWPDPCPVAVWSPACPPRRYGGDRGVPRRQSIGRRDPAG